MRVWRSATILAHFLTTVRRIDNFVVGKEFVGEDRSLDRILRRLKLHAKAVSLAAKILELASASSRSR
jgi:hypothetical protein